MGQTKHRTRVDVILPSGISSEPLLARIAIGLVLLLVVTRPAFPSEDADTGSGLVVVALWGVAAILWAGVQSLQAGLTLYARWYDALPVLLLSAVILSATQADTPRAAINVASEWGGTILAYFMIRQMFRDSNSQRALIVSCLATAFALAAYGIYQAFWEFELNRAAFARDRLGILESLDILPGSPQEESFKNRLNSHEPFATFALANSLAGFLLAWLPCSVVGFTSSLIAQKSSSIAPQPNRLRRLILMTGCAASGLITLTILVCLILTQSRTAYVGLVVEALIAASLLRQSTGRPWLGLQTRAIAMLALTSLGVIVAVMVVAVNRGKLDEKLFTEAKRSLGFRWEYWVATTHLIQEQPWCGTGPGNFRSHYLKHKLVESSEEIADPHNMILEVAATCGLFAAMAFLTFLAVAIARALRGKPAWNATPRGPRDLAVVCIAGLGGFMLAEALSVPNVPLYCGLVLSWLAAVCVFWWNFPVAGPRLLGCAAAGLAVHFLGAGGIIMPGVGQSLWVLLALGLNLAEAGEPPLVVAGKTPGRLLFGGVTAAAIAFLWLVVGPVAASTSAVSLGQRRRLNGDLAGAETQFRKATHLDGLWSEPWVELSRSYYERWRGGHGRQVDDQFANAAKALEEAIRRGPSRLEPRRMLAQLMEIRAAESGSHWMEAVEAYRACVERFPTNPTLRVQLARALWEAGRFGEAKSQAAAALELDIRTPHQDKKLTDQSRELLKPILDADTTNDTERTLQRPASEVK